MNIAELFNREAFPISHGSWENRWKVSLIPSTQLRWTIKTNTGIKDLDSDLFLVTNTWYNITVYYNGSDFELYVNGELNSFSNFSGLIQTTTYDLMIGQRLPNDYNYNFKGILDDIRIYNYGLSVQEIQDLYNITSSIDENLRNEVPLSYSLAQNFPNPFNPTTEISWQLAVGSQVKLIVYTITGQEVATLVNERQTAGIHSITFDASGLASGVYLYRLSVGSLTGEAEVFVETRKMVLMR